MNLLLNLLKAVPNSVKGLINSDELWRSIFTAMGGGGVLGLVITILTGLSSHAALVFPNPIIAALVTSFLGLVVDLLRRQADGKPAELLAPGSVVPPSGAMAPPPTDAVAVTDPGGTV